MAFSSTVNASALKKTHGYEEDTAHHLSVGQKGPQFLDQRIRLTRHDKLEILPQGAEELVLGEDVREGHEDKDQQWYEREQGIIGDRPSEQDALVGAKPFQHGERERARTLKNLCGPATQVPHRENSSERLGASRAVPVYAAHYGRPLSPNTRRTGYP